MTIEIGIAPLDSDHRLLLAMLSDLADAASSGASPEELEDMSLEVVASLESHFAKEERMLEEAQDSLRTLHIARHAELLDGLARLSGLVLAGMGPKGASDAVRAFMAELTIEIEAFDQAAVPGILGIPKN